MGLSKKKNRKGRLVGRTGNGNNMHTAKSTEKVKVKMLWKANQSCSSYNRLGNCQVTQGGEEGKFTEAALEIALNKFCYHLLKSFLL